MPNAVDFAILLVVAAVALWQHLLGWPRWRAALAAGTPGARLRGYRFIVAQQWLVAAAVIGQWVAGHRRWADLGLAVPTGWRLGVAAAGVALIAWNTRAQVRVAPRLKVETRLALRRRMGAIAVALPHTAEEHRWSMALAVTAGVCEELLFRGFVVWALAPWLGLWGASAASVVVFALEHAYQGASGVLRVAVVGAVLAGLALLTRSLLPGMVMHALVDVGSSTLVYGALREGAPPPGGAGAAGLARAS